VLAFVFGSLLAVLPLGIAFLVIPTTFLGILAFTTVTTMSTLDENIVALIGLGIGIDYALTGSQLRGPRNGRRERPRWRARFSQH
jgi:RND superfamily putative drug exporter